MIRFELALVVSTATAAATLAYAPTEPYAAIITVLLPPVFVLAWSGLRAGASANDGRHGGWAAVVGVGLFLGVGRAVLHTALRLRRVHARDHGAAVGGRQTAVGPAAAARRHRGSSRVAIALHRLGAVSACGRAGGSPADSGTAQHYLPRRRRAADVPDAATSPCSARSAWSARCGWSCGPAARRGPARWPSPCSRSMVVAAVDADHAGGHDAAVVPAAAHADVLLVAAGAFGFVETALAIAARYTPADRAARRRRGCRARRDRRRRRSPRTSPTSCDPTSSSPTPTPTAAASAPTVGRPAPSSTTARRHQDRRRHRQTPQPDRRDDRRLQLPRLLPLLRVSRSDVALRQPARAVQGAVRGHRGLGDHDEARRVRPPPSTPCRGRPRRSS